jgi:hypothetical protein
MVQGLWLGEKKFSEVWDNLQLHVTGSRQFHRVVASSLGEDLPAAATAGSSGKRLF